MIYENVKNIAFKQGMSIAELERKAKLGNGAIGKWRKSSPSVDTLSKVADVLGVSFDNILKG